MTVYVALFYAISFQFVQTVFFVFDRFEFSIIIFNLLVLQIYQYSSIPEVGHSDLCNSISLLPALLVDGLADTTSSLNPSLYLLLDLVHNFTLSHPENPYQALNDAAYVASFVTVHYPNQVDSEWGETAFAFCGDACSVLAFAVYDYYNQAISQYYYTLVNGSCDAIFDTTNW